MTFNQLKKLLRQSRFYLLLVIQYSNKNQPHADFTHEHRVKRTSPSSGKPVSSPDKVRSSERSFARDRPKAKHPPACEQHNYSRWYFL